MGLLVGVVGGRVVAGGQGVGRRMAGRGLGFTLIELLVVVGIIAVLVAILLPSLGKARDRAKVVTNLANLKSMGLGVSLYQTENDGYFFVHEGNYNAPGIFSDDVRDNSGVFSDTGALVAEGLVADVAAGNKSRRAHWPDYIFDYVNSPKFYLSPMLSAEERANFTVDFVKPGVYKRSRWGGYGYNFQFLGRAWKAGAGAYRARVGKEVRMPSMTVVIGDSAGSRKGATPPGGLMSNSYVIDPPLYTVSTGARIGKYYQAPDAGTSDADRAATAVGSSDWRWRVFPAPRNQGKAGFVFADGHADVLSLKEVDDINGDGIYDNGYWNGTGAADAGVR